MGRLRLGVPGVLDLVTGQRRCTVVDLSREGARLALARPPHVGEWGLLAIEQVDVFGCVVWQLDQMCGMKFEAPISNDQLIEFRSRREELIAAELAQPVEFARSWVQGG